MSSYDEAIASIAQKELGRIPRAIQRMSHGICNEVYLVALDDDRELIFRMNTQPRYIVGSHNHIPIFRSRGIMVPDIVAEDYSMTDIPIAYQVQTVLPGRDIKDGIATLTDDELSDLGGR